jgi:hypothetical protein
VDDTRLTEGPVEVEYAEQWYAAVLRGWTTHPDGSAWAQITVRGRTGAFLDSVPGSRVRPSP